MIRCDRLPPDNKLVFSDDRALLPPGFNNDIQHWLSEWKPRPYLVLREPIPIYDYAELPDISAMTVKQMYFQRELWQLDNMRRVFMAAVCPERGWQILGPEIDPKELYWIAPSPVVEVIVRERDKPPASVHELSSLAAEVWATLSDTEREKHLRIGQVAALADLDALL
jgi:hypothetical protein